MQNKKSVYSNLKNYFYCKIVESALKFIFNKNKLAFATICLNAVNPKKNLRILLQKKYFSFLSASLDS